jgi:hypothetical protein
MLVTARKSAKAGVTLVPMDGSNEVLRTILFPMRIAPDRKKKAAMHKP